jgi:aflatoxin B1 aldehyde reductase
MSSTSIKPIFGAAQLGTTPKFPDNVAEETFKVLEAAGCDTIDTTHDWPGSEAWLGKVKAGTRFTVNSKTPGGIVPGQSTATGVVEHARELAGYIGAENVGPFSLAAPLPRLTNSHRSTCTSSTHRIPPSLSQRP